MVEGEEEGDGQKEEGSRLFIIEDTFLLLPPKQSAVTAHLTVSIFMCVAVNFYNDALQMQTDGRRTRQLRKLPPHTFSSRCIRAQKTTHQTLEVRLSAHL